MAAGDFPEGLERGRHVELDHRERQVVLRRALIALLAAVPVIALVNLVGQRSSATVAARPAATLTVRAPARLRGGLLYQVAFTVVAHRAISSLHLVLSPGWFDGLSLNTMEPAASNEGSRNGRVSLSYGTLDPGQKLVVFTEWQVNPTTIGRRHLTVDVDDGGKLLARARRTLTIFP